MPLPPTFNHDPQGSAAVVLPQPPRSNRAATVREQAAVFCRVGHGVGDIVTLKTETAEEQWEILEIRPAV